jgi:toxin YhaV
MDGQFFSTHCLTSIWVKLFNRVRVLKTKLTKEDFIKHPDVKLFKALDIGIKEKIPQDPFASYFILQKPLHRAC